MAERTNNPHGQAISDKFIQEYLTTNFGEESVRIIKAANEEMTDDALAVKCKLKVSEIRTVLNKMHNLRLAEYTRIKDKDTGWYSYIWRVDLSNIYSTLDSLMRNEINQLSNQMDESTTMLSYICSKCSKNNIIDFEIASRLAFRCPNCRRRLYEKKNSMVDVEEKLGDLKRKHSVLRDRIGKIEEVRKVAEMKRLEAVQAAREVAEKVTLMEKAAKIKAKALKMKLARKAKSTNQTKKAKAAKPSKKSAKKPSGKKKRK